ATRSGDPPSPDRAVGRRRAVGSHGRRRDRRCDRRRACRAVIPRRGVLVRVAAVAVAAVASPFGLGWPVFILANVAAAAILAVDWRGGPPAGWGPPGGGGGE